MTFRLRAARAADLEPLYEMAKLTGGGFTNLPPDRAALGAKLDCACKKGVVSNNPRIRDRFNILQSYNYGIFDGN